MLIIPIGSTRIMHTEYEEFETIEEMFMYIASAIPPIKNTVPVSSYRGYIISFTPLGHGNADSYLMVYTEGTLDTGIYEFDMAARKYFPVERIERADKIYFIVMTPKRNTLADGAIKSINDV